MRCKNCGWENEAGSLKCVKCNAPLKGSMVDSSHENDYESETDESENLDGTISEKKYFGSKKHDDVDDASDTPSSNHGDRICHKCGYQISPLMKVCPACGTHLDSDTADNENRSKSSKKCPSCGNEIISGTKFCPYCGRPLRLGTIKAGPAATPGSYFTLKALPWENEHVEYQPTTFCGSSVELNRGNTDPNNNSITSKVQAVLSNENGKWFIEDKSDFQSTYIHVNGKVEIHDGDIIVLGNRMFEFRS